MPNTATLQREAAVDVYRSVEQGLKETGAEACGLMFIHCAGQVQPEQQVRTHLEHAGYASFEVWQDSKTQTVAVLLPGLSLDEVHYEGLRIKHELQESVPGADPQITLASFPPGSALRRQRFSIWPNLRSLWIHRKFISIRWSIRRMTRNGF